MFKYISSILAQFSTPQKILALSILLLSIIIITISPSLISSITLDREELNSEIKKQDLKIEKLESNIDSLEYSIRKNGRECTNAIISREEQFLEMLDKLKGDLRNNNTEERIVKLNSNVLERKIYPSNDSLQMTMMPEENKNQKIIIYKKSQVNSTISLIDQMKKELEKH